MSGDFSLFCRLFGGLRWPGPITRIASHLAPPTANHPQFSGWRGGAPSKRTTLSYKLNVPSIPQQHRLPRRSQTISPPAWRAAKPNRLSPRVGHYPVPCYLPLRTVWAFIACVITVPAADNKKPWLIARAWIHFSMQGKSYPSYFFSDETTSSIIIAKFSFRSFLLTLSRRSRRLV
jgi:hypothetical protein